jgi:hypothetical protein
MRIRKQDGSVLLVTLMVLMALTVLGIGCIFIAGMDNEIAVNGRAGEQALFSADAGVNWGLDAVAANPGYAIQGYKTTFFGGTNATKIIQDNSGTNQIFPGGFSAAFDVQVGPSVNQKGKSVDCGLIGFSDKYGSLRFAVTSLGYGPGNAKRQVDAVVLLPPQEGLCGGSLEACNGYVGGC